MLYVSISDLHMGAPDSLFNLSRFSGLAAARNWVGDASCLVLNGDICDGAYLDEREGKEVLANLSRSLSFKNTIYIPGNHDCMCSLQGSTFPFGFTVSTTGGPVHFTHGHTCSPYLFSVLNELFPPENLSLDMVYGVANGVAKSLMNLSHTPLGERPLIQVILEIIQQHPGEQSLSRAVAGLVKSVASDRNNKLLKQMAGVVGRAMAWYIAGSAPSLLRSQSIAGSAGLTEGIARYLSMLSPAPTHLVMGHTHKVEHGTEVFGPGMSRPVKVWNGGSWQGAGNGGGVVLVDTSATEPVLVNLSWPSGPLAPQHR